ncbi:ephrin type-A receptor 4-A-like [Teleopsis dalmanni]|uniref:ephrin type-A receptor 4-A-like n=1 Tax=Teleopsis dalmanni TaxID=139649 RepID=UPI0018CDAB67|nr:ephrin type-A receptor 4-A-like [Teleopsis dalmanni]
MMVYNSKLSIANWLDLLDLQQYETNLQMYNRVEDISELNDNDLKRLGIRSASHRNKMLSSLVGVLQAKRRQSMNIEGSLLKYCEKWILYISKRLQQTKSDFGDPLK